MRARRLCRPCRYGEYESEYPSGPLAWLRRSLRFRMREHTFYLVEDFAARWPDLLSELGKHRASKACMVIT